MCKNISNYLEERSSNYHLSPTKTVNGTTYKLLRHTPKNRQKMFLYEPLFIEAKANVLPSIFNPEYLDIKIMSRLIIGSRLTTALA